MEIIWNDCVKNEVLHTVKEDRNISHTIKRKKANGIGHILDRKYLLSHITEGKIKVEGIEGQG